jgi:hypothetical protein
MEIDALRSGSNRGGQAAEATVPAPMHLPPSTEAHSTHRIVSPKKNDRTNTGNLDGRSPEIVATDGGCDSEGDDEMR